VPGTGEVTQVADQRKALGPISQRRTILHSPIRILPLAILVVMALTLPVAGQLFGSSETRLGEQEVILPDPMVVQVTEGSALFAEPIPAHRHAMGWFYSKWGTHTLTMGGREIKISRDTPAWIPENVEHGHTWDPKERMSPLPHTFLFIEITSRPGDPMTGAWWIGVTDPVRGLGRGPSMLRLIRLDLDLPSFINFTQLLPGDFPKVFVVLDAGRDNFIETREPGGPPQSHPLRGVMLIQASSSQSQFLRVPTGGRASMLLLQFAPKQ